MSDSDSSISELEEKLKKAEAEIALLKTQLNKLADTDESAEFNIGANTVYAHLLDLIPLEITVLNAEKHIMYLNKFHKISDSQRVNAIGKTEEEFCQMIGIPESVAINRSFLLNSAVFERQSKIWEESFINEAGIEIFLLRTMIPVFNDAGDFSFILSVASDITDQVTTEKLVRNSEERFRLLVNGAREYILVQLDNSGKIESWNTGAINITGYEPSEVTGKHWKMIYAEDGDAQFVADFTHYHPESHQDLKRIFKRKDGSIFQVELNYSALFNLHNEQIGYAVMARDLTMQIESERALRESEEKYRSIIENMNLGLYETNQFNNITYINKSFSQMAGIQVDDLLGKTLEETFMSNCIRKVLKNEKVNQFRIEEIKYTSPLGIESWWLLSVTPRHENTGEFSGNLAIVLDITERKALETELDNSLKNAESLAAAKQIFLANMSHELRTPLNAVIGLTRLLQKEPLTGKQQQYLSSMVYSGNNLLNIIEDLLDFSKLEAGKMNLVPKTFNLKDLIKNNVRMLQFKCEENGISLIYDLDPGIEEFIITDPVRLNQILVNLIGNSVKFTNNGSVKINCKLIEDKAKSQLLEFSVIDTGIGIPEDKLDKVFEMFYQVGYQNSSTNKGGTGLGLSITKQLVERLGGKINIISKVGEGTSVSFNLRVGKGTPPVITNEPSQVLNSELLKDKRILLAEDNEINRMLVQAVLEQYAIKLAEAVNGNEVISILKKQEFDLILMDIRMPEMDGIQTTRNIRENLHSTTPILALTADVSEEGHKEWIRAGMNDYMLKPFDEHQLILKISKLLGIHQESTEVKTILEPDIEISSAINESILHEHLQLENLTRITRGDNDFLKRMLNVFVNQILDTMDPIRVCVQTENLVELRDIFHKIKPGIMNTCGKDTCDLFNKIHDQIRGGDLKNLSTQIETLLSSFNDTIKAIQSLEY